MPGGNPGTQASGEALRNKRYAITLKRLQEKVDTGKSIGVGRALVRLDRGTTSVLLGLEDLSTWDIEELRRGRKRGKNGKLDGRNPKVVAKAVHDELVKRTLESANNHLIQNLEAALKVLTEIMNDKKADNKDRIAAIKMIADRAMGREPQTVNIGGEAKWQAAITHSIVSMPAALVDPDIADRDEDEDDDTTND